MFDIGMLSGLLGGGGAAGAAGAAGGGAGGIGGLLGGGLLGGLLGGGKAGGMGGLKALSPFLMLLDGLKGGKKDDEEDKPKLDPSLIAAQAGAPRSTLSAPESLADMAHLDAVDAAKKAAKPFWSTNYGETGMTPQQMLMAGAQGFQAGRPEQQAQYARQPDPMLQMMPQQMQLQQQSYQPLNTTYAQGGQRPMGGYFQPYFGR